MANVTLIFSSFSMFWARFNIFKTKGIVSKFLFKYEANLSKYLKSTPPENHRFPNDFRVIEVN